MAGERMKDLGYPCMIFVAVVKKSTVSLYPVSVQRLKYWRLYKCSIYPLFWKGQSCLIL